MTEDGAPATAEVASEQGDEGCREKGVLYFLKQPPKVLRFRSFRINNLNLMRNNSHFFCYFFGPLKSRTYKERNTRVHRVTKSVTF